MHSKAKPATKAEKVRFARIVELGCVACRAQTPDDKKLIWCGIPEVHHLLDGGIRRGHSYTICLGTFHHRGLAKPEVVSVREMTEWFGPSLYHDARGFHARFGTDDELLDYQNLLLKEAADEAQGIRRTRPGDAGRTEEVLEPFERRPWEEDDPD
jgi:hypothetical protein